MVDAAEAAALLRVCNFAMPNGHLIGQPGRGYDVRELPGGLFAAQRDFLYLSAGGTPVPSGNGVLARLPGNAGFIGLRPVTSSAGSPAVDINVPGVPFSKIHY